MASFFAHTYADVDPSNQHRIGQAVCLFFETFATYQHLLRFSCIRIGRPSETPQSGHVLEMCIRHFPKYSALVAKVATMEDRAVFNLRTFEVVPSRSKTAS